MSDVSVRIEPDVIKSQSLYKRASRVMPGGNSRDTIFYPPFPVYAETGKGCRVVDVDGIERIDFVNNYSSLIHGHRHPKVEAAVKDQLSKIWAVGLPTEEEVELAELLCSQVPSVEKVRFTNSGTEAVMNALKAARAFTGKPKIAKAEGAYHGSYDWTEISVGPNQKECGPIDFPNSVARGPGTSSASRDEVIVFNYNDIERTKRQLESHAGELAAVLIDPLVSRMSYLAATQSFLEMLREVTTKNDILLVFDEVYSLRLASGGLQKKRGICPDITAMGKIIGGGFPIGAVGGRSDIMSVFDPSLGSPRLPHGGTYNANPISMAAGKASMQLLTSDCYAHLDRLGAMARQGLQDIIDQHDVEAQVAGEGSVFAILPMRGEVRSWRDFMKCLGRVDRISALHHYMLDSGILMAPHGTFTLSSVMTEAEVEDLLNAASRVVRNL